MNCPTCSSTHTKVTDSCAAGSAHVGKKWPKRLPQQDSSRFRSRTCQDCYNIFWSIETLLDRNSLLAYEGGKAHG